jgi:hypothetical protein
MSFSGNQHNVARSRHPKGGLNGAGTVDLQEIIGTGSFALREDALFDFAEDPGGVLGVWIFGGDS